MSGTGRVYVQGTPTRASNNTYSVTVRFDIAFDYGAYNYNSPLWAISVDALAAQTGNTNISVASGNGTWVWQHMGDKTFTVTMPTNGATKTITLRGSCYTGVNPSEINVTGSYTLPALTWQWTVSYNANGGSGAPSNQTKTRGSNLTLSSTKPTRTGYTFQGWGTSASATSASYQAGGTYSTDANITLYAIWKINTYTVSYNANGGSGAPSSQTKTYNTNLTLSTTKPTRTNYDFLGWSKSSSATSATYAAGGTFTENANTTLYAVWKLAYWNPRLSNLKLERCDSDGTTASYGTYCKATFTWSICTTSGTNSVKSCVVTYGSSSATSSVSLSDTSGTTSVVIGTVETESSTAVKVTLTDSLGGSTSLSSSLSPVEYTIDFKAGGRGIAFGKPSETDGYVESGWNHKVLRSGDGKNAGFWAFREDNSVGASIQVGTDGNNVLVMRHNADGSATSMLNSNAKGTVYVNGINTYNIFQTNTTVSSNLNNNQIGIQPYTNTSSNTPVTGWGNVITVGVNRELAGGNSSSGAWLSQIAFGTDHRLYHRHRGNGGSWGDWCMVYDGANTPSRISTFQKSQATGTWSYIKYDSGMFIAYYTGSRTSSKGWNGVSVTTPFTVYNVTITVGISVDSDTECYSGYTRCVNNSSIQTYYKATYANTAYYCIALFGRYS